MFSFINTSRSAFVRHIQLFEAAIPRGRFDKTGTDSTGEIRNLVEFHHASFPLQQLQQSKHDDPINR